MLSLPSLHAVFSDSAVAHVCPHPSQLSALLRSCTNHTPTLGWEPFLPPSGCRACLNALCERFCGQRLLAVGSALKRGRWQCIPAAAVRIDRVASTEPIPTQQEEQRADLALSPLVDVSALDQVSSIASQVSTTYICMVRSHTAYRLLWIIQYRTQPSFAATLHRHPSPPSFNTILHRCEPSLKRSSHNRPPNRCYWHQPPKAHHRFTHAAAQWFDSLRLSCARWRRRVGHPNGFHTVTSPHRHGMRVFFT